MSYVAARQSAEHGGRELMRDKSLQCWIDPHLSPEILESILLLSLLISSREARANQGCTKKSSCWQGGLAVQLAICQKPVPTLQESHF